MNFCGYTIAGAAIAAALSVTPPATAGGDIRAAEAPAHYGWYVEGRYGGALDTDRDVDMVSANVPGANGVLGIDPDDGYGFTLAVGKQLNERWRAELQYGRGEADDITVDYTGAPLNPLFPQILPATGDISVDTLMVTALRSWRRKFFGHFRPFSGASIGFAHVDVSNMAPAGSRFIVDDSDTVLVLAHHTGVDVDLTERATFTLRLSGVLTQGGDFDAIDTLNAGGIMRIEGDTEYDRVVTAGIRIKFGSRAVVDAALK